MADVLGRAPGFVVKAEDREPIVTEWLPAVANGGKVDWSNCPPSYSVWYEQYGHDIRYWTSRAGVNPRELDEVVAMLVTRFIERDSLGVFRRDWSTRSASGKSNFRSYNSNFFFQNARGKHRNNVRYAIHNSLILDAEIGDDGTTAHDMLAPSHYDEDTVDFADLVKDLRKAFTDEQGDSDVLDAVLRLAMETPAVKVTELRTALGVSQSRASESLAKVRAVLGEVVQARKYRVDAV